VVGWEQKEKEKMKRLSWLVLLSVTTAFAAKPPSVLQKGKTGGCQTLGTPSGFSLVTELNPVQPNGAALITTLMIGNAIRVRPVDLNGDNIPDSLAVFVTSGMSGTQATYIFLLDPSTGMMQTTNPITGAAWQNPILLLTGFRATVAAAGDVNGDGVPDFLLSFGYNNAAYLFVGQVNNNNLSYTAYKISPPAGSPSYFGQAIALGDLDGDGKDEIAVGATSPDSRNKTLPSVFIFKFDPVAHSVKYVSTFQDPSGSSSSQFGAAIAIGDVDGSTGNDLVVGAPGGGTNGLVYIFPNFAQQTTYFTLSGPGPLFGRNLGIADMNGDNSPDLMVVTGAQFSGSDTSAQTLVYPGPVHLGETYGNQLLPATGLSYSYGAPNTDVAAMAAAGAFVVGAPNASTCSTQIGAVHLYTAPLSSSQHPSYLFQPPTLQSGSNSAFGYGVGISPGYPFLIVGDHSLSVGSTSAAGQVYVYKKN
jgi:VCBS repeat protein